MDYLEAEYETGYVHSNRYYDVSPYALNEEGKLGPNVFYDILHKLPESVHGRMVRFSLVTPTDTYSVDWTGLPDNARPIFLKHMEADSIGGEITDVRCIKLEFGYQFNDEDGKNHKVIEEI